MVDLVGSRNGTAPAVQEKLCPLAWSPIQQQGPPGLVIPNNGLGFMAGNCVGARCAWWSDSTGGCAILTVPRISTALENTNAALEAILDAAPVSAHALEDAGFRAPAAGAMPTPALAPLVERALQFAGTTVDQADRGIRARERIGDELRRLRHVVLGVYALVSHQLPGLPGTARTIEATGRQQSGDDRHGDSGGETPGVAG